MAEQTHTIDAVNGPVLASGYTQTRFENTLKYLIPKLDTSARLKEIAKAEGYQVLVPTRDADRIVSSATVQWPDGSAGVWTGTNKNPTFLYYDGWTLTHANSGKTVTQPPVTRNEDGETISYPPLTIS